MSNTQSQNPPTITVGGISYKRLDFENEMTIAQFEDIVGTVKKFAYLVDGSIKPELFISEVISVIVEKRAHAELLAKLYFDENGNSIGNDISNAKFGVVVGALKDFFGSIFSYITDVSQTSSQAKKR